MLNVLRQFLEKNISQEEKQKNAYALRIASVNVETEEIVFQVKNKSLTIPSTFMDAIWDSGIITHLSPIEASYLGGYYGRSLKKNLKKSGALKKTRSQSFLLEGEGGKYQVSYLARSSELGYFNKETKEQFVACPIALANNEYIISHFNSCQACYIGILAGILMGKSETAKDRKKNPVSRPALHVVK